MPFPCALRPFDALRPLLIKQLIKSPKMSAKGEKYKSKKQMMKHEKNESAKKRVMEAGTANGGRMSYSTSRKAC